ncbi:ABC transporter substrate-binding protein [Spirulina sp. CS-785/01]|uniref:ABC transporter substrate-binding protein n=1 Tax=Spirulina sp. CS-785/01 TaxID=3021716 RepID=UPI002330070A|nr:ABC transporter substrate-binding protein [Spirulina sp. CS-785/01]MDB9312195.1 ABC transporter substrate-binding protein [Spirulina sp. CS-785/01]
MVLFCCTLLVILGACQGQGAEIRLGVIAPLTGDVAETSGIPTVEGIQLAIAEINETGGLEFNGRKHPITLIVEDDKDNPFSLNAPNPPKNWTNFLQKRFAERPRRGNAQC